MADPNTFEFCSPEVLDDFAGTGSRTLSSVLHSVSDSPAEFINEACVVFTEILMAVEENLLETKVVAKFLNGALLDQKLAVLFCQVCDVYPSKDITTKLLDLLSKSSTLNHLTMAANLDSSLLMEIGLLLADSFNRQFSTRRRDYYFTQKKFNLFHEEFEGYSLIINELEAFLSESNNASSVDNAVEAVNKIMGHYLLDPNRVIDLILYIFANFLVGNHIFIIGFLKKSLWWPKIEANCFNGFESLSYGGCSAASNAIALQMKKFPMLELPETFKILFAILIKEGFISFGSICNIIPPGEEAMSLLEKTYHSELEGEIFRASANALALAAPLKDDDEENENRTSQAPLSTERKEDLTVETLAKQNMKLQMLRCFLANGLYWPSIYLLSQYPFLAHVEKEVGELMNRLLAALISPLHQQLSVVSKEESNVLRQKKLITAVVRGKLATEEPLIIEQYCFKPTIKNHGSKQYTYFYQEWTRNTPVCLTKEDLVEISSQFLKFFGPVLAQNHANFIQLCEIISHDLKKDDSDKNKAMWLAYFRNYIFPYIGSVQDNSVAVDKAYSILELYDSKDRFNLYGELNQVLAKSNPFVKISFGKAEKATKDTLKRLSKENVSQMMRKLASISISNPLPCFLTIIQQIESYDNLISLVVDTAAHFSRYCWDNMTLALLLRLSASGRSNVMGNGLDDLHWIQSLASFIGKLCQRYPSKIDLDTLIMYLLKSFHVNDNSELLVLKEIISCMGGFQAITNLTQLQVNMMSCEPSLAKIVFKTIGDSRYDRRESGMKLALTLLIEDHGSELVVLLSKLDHQIMADSSLSHLKILASRRDEISATLRLLCSLFSFFCESTPSLFPLTELVSRFNVPIPWAFEIWRRFLPAETLLVGLSNSVDPSLFYTYWKLDLYDINYTADLYDSEMEKLKSSLIQQKEELNFLTSSKRESSKTDPVRANIKRIEQTISEIPDLKAAHERHNNKIIENLRQESISWFVNGENDKSATRNFIQECILPRAVHSCFDAIFTAKFLFKLHEIQAQGASVLDALHVLFHSRVLFSTLFTLTPTEAENLGLFLSVTLQELDLWRNEKTFSSVNEISPLTFGEHTQFSFVEFKQLLFDFHATILDDISRALRVTSYMSRINAITFLKNLLNIYPIVEDHCEEITCLIENVSKNDTRDDLKLSSAALIGHVKSRKSRWVHMWDFYEMDEESKSDCQKKRELMEQNEKVLLAIKQKAMVEQQRVEASQKEEWKAENRERTVREQSSQASVSSIDYSDKLNSIPRPADRIKGLVAPKRRYDRYTGASDKDGTPSASEVPRNEQSQLPASPKSFSRESTPIGPRGSSAISLNSAQSIDLFSKKLDLKDSGRNTLVSTPKSSSTAGGNIASTRKETASSNSSSQVRQRSALPPQQAPVIRRVTLQPQRAPDRRTRVTLPQQRISVPAGPSSAQNSSKRAPLPPQMAPSSSRYDNRQGSRDQGRNNLGASNARERTQISRDNARTNGSSGRNNSGRNTSNPSSDRPGDRASGDNGRRIPASSTPLPPPSLPPPSMPPPIHLNDGRPNKRSYEDDTSRNDKRRRR